MYTTMLCTVGRTPSLKYISRHRGGQVIYVRSLQLPLNARHASPSSEYVAGGDEVGPQPRAGRGLKVHKRLTHGAAVDP